MWLVMNRYVLALLAALLVSIAGAIQFASVDFVCDLAGYCGCSYDSDQDGSVRSCNVTVGWFELYVCGNDTGEIDRVSIQKSSASR
ncbi:MAG: hypothetical protein JWP89_1917 [Schlesneria sp.]|nr:hypothetical protein [Schlesneria sp.]